MSGGRWRVIFVALALPLLIAACSSSSKASSGTTPTTPATPTSPPVTSAPAPTAPAQNVEADKARAAAASLKLSDFPAGWTSSPSTATNGPSGLKAQVAKCLGVSESNLTDPPASYDSPDFNDPNNNTISDTVGYRATPADQDAPFAVVSSDKVPACLGTAFTKVINDAIKHPTNPSDTLPEGVTVGTPTVSPMSFPQFGDKSTAYRTTSPSPTRA
jgi:hypothetical protein